MKQQVNKSLDRILKIFQERDAVFDVISRQKAEKIHMKEQAPPIGKYTPKYEVVDGKVRTPFFNQRRTESPMLNLSMDMSNSFTRLSELQSLRMKSYRDHIQQTKE